MQNTLNINQLPTYGELVAFKCLERAPSYKRARYGLSPEECRYNESAVNDYYESLHTGQMGYLKSLQPHEAFSAELAARVARRVNLPCPQTEIDACRDEDKIIYACFSPLHGKGSRTLGRFMLEETYNAVSPSFAHDIAPISQGISSHIPFWILTANWDVHPANVIVAAPENGQGSFVYSIDHEALDYQIGKIHPISLGHIFVPEGRFSSTQTQCRKLPRR